MITDRHCALTKKHVYQYCPDCGVGVIEDSYKFAYCSENCRDIFRICNKFVCKTITVAEAKEQIEKCDLTDLEYFDVNIQKNIADILSYKPEKKEEFVKIMPKKRGRKKIVNQEN